MCVTGSCALYMPVEEVVYKDLQAILALWYCMVRA